jgi:ribosomal protein S18 acetylase RimI-like enzyme
MEGKSSKRRFLVSYNLHVVQGVEEIDRFFPQFNKVYQEAFGGAPYFESFTEEEVYKIFQELVLSKDSACLLLFQKHSLVGVAGGFNVGLDEQISSLLKYNLEPLNAFYLAELAVSTGERNKGHGTMLTKKLVDYVKETTELKKILVRTQKRDSNAKNIFLRIGFQELPFIQKVETFERKNGSRVPVFQERMFLLL